MIAITPKRVSFCERLTVCEDGFCQEIKCPYYRSEWSENWCIIHAITHRVVNLAQAKNHYFKNRNLLIFKLERVLFKIVDWIEDYKNWILNYNDYISNLEKLVEIIYQSTKVKIDVKDIQSGEDGLIQLDCSLIDSESQFGIEGPIERTIYYFTWVDNLNEYLDSI